MLAGCSRLIQLHADDARAFYPAPQKTHQQGCHSGHASSDSTLGSTYLAAPSSSDGNGAAILSIGHCGSVGSDDLQQAADQINCSLPAAPLNGVGKVTSQEPARCSHRLRKRRRAQGLQLHGEPAEYQSTGFTKHEAALATAEAKAKAIEALQLIALAQRLAQREAAQLRRRNAQRQADEPLDVDVGRFSDEGSQLQPGNCSKTGSARRPRSSSSFRQAVLGARIAVLRSTNNGLHTFCKGEVVESSSRRQQCCVRFDDGEEQWLCLQQQHFRWLGPRAPSAGCTLSMKAAMVAASALNVMEGPLPEGPGSNSGGQLPPADSAVADRVTVLFPGDGQQHAGWVLAYDEEAGKHHVLYDDGEDEWLNLTEDAMQWHAADVNTPMHSGFPPGTSPPAADLAVGWQLGIYWNEDKLFYQARVVGFDAATGAHLILYEDGEREAVRLQHEVVKWLHPPQGTAAGRRLVKPSVLASPSFPCSTSTAAGEDAGSCDGARPLHLASREDTAAADLRAEPLPHGDARYPSPALLAPCCMHLLPPPAQHLGMRHTCTMPTAAASLFGGQPAVMVPQAMPVSCPDMVAGSCTPAGSSPGPASPVDTTYPFQRALPMLPVSGSQNSLCNTFLGPPLLDHTDTDLSDSICDMLCDTEPQSVVGGLIPAFGDLPSRSSPAIAAEMQAAAGTPTPISLPSECDATASCWDLDMSGSADAMGPDDALLAGPELQGLLNSFVVG